MIDVGAKSVCFACDECGIHEQIERRMQVARELGEISNTTIVVATKSEMSFGPEGTARTLLLRNPPKEMKSGAKRAVRTGAKCAARPSKSIASGMVRGGRLGHTSTGIGRAMNMSLAITLNIPEAQKTRCSSSVCRTRQSAGVKASRSRGTDTVRCSTTGGRLLREAIH